MSMDVRTRAAATFSALILTSLLTTSAAIAATGVGMMRPHLAGCSAGSCVIGPASLQAKPAHVAKVSAAIAMRGRRY